MTLDTTLRIAKGQLTLLQDRIDLLLSNDGSATCDEMRAAVFACLDVAATLGIAVRQAADHSASLLSGENNYTN